jgi:hypothetical protein
MSAAQLSALARRDRIAIIRRPAPEPAAAFYEAVLGWRREPFEDAGPGVSLLRLGGSVIAPPHDAPPFRRAVLAAPDVLGQRAAPVSARGPSAR